MLDQSLLNVVFYLKSLSMHSAKMTLGLGVTSVLAHKSFTQFKNLVKLKSSLCLFESVRELINTRREISFGGVRVNCILNLNFGKVNLLRFEIYIFLHHHQIILQ